MQHEHNDAVEEVPADNTPNTPNEAVQPEKSAWKTWLKRVGWGGFFFFLLKGLAWIAVWSLGWKTLCN
jgi:hypothetical protein